MKTKIIAVSLITLIAFSGCKLGDKLADLTSTITKESTEAYENVVTEVETKADAVEDKINKINTAAEDISEAASAVSEAVDSIQAINDTATGTTAE